MKYWKKPINHLNRYMRLAIYATALSATSLAHADPNDALEQLIKQRQQAQPAQQQDDLEKLIRSKTNDSQPNRVNYNFIQPRTAPAQAATQQNALQTAKAIANKPAGKPVTAAQALSIFRPRPAVATSSMNRSDADTLISNAMGFIGVAYRFGGTTPSGFDCSGFMQYVFRKAFAVNLPRTAAQQASVGSHVSRSNLQAGDMVFFRTAGPRRISHVGMYVGNDRFIHAPRTGKRIEITSLSNKYWSAKYATARRVKRQGADRFIN